MAIDPIIVWLRNDLRLDDHPAMSSAVETGAPIVCVYIRDELSSDPPAMGAAQKWWLHHSLNSLKERIEAIGGCLLFKSGRSLNVLAELANEIGSTKIFWSRRYSPHHVRTDTDMKAGLERAGITVQSFNGSLCTEPWTIQSKSKTPYRVFTPYWKQLRSMGPERSPLDAVKKLSAPKIALDSEDLEDWALCPKAPDWASAFGSTWTPGEIGAQKRWRTWLNDKNAHQYASLRDRPDIEATSRLSPHLHFGEISPIRLWHDIMALVDTGGFPSKDGEKFLSELAWREFSYQLTYHHPDMDRDPLQPQFSRFPWDNDSEKLKSWQMGQTGYPIVDAGMRQLWQTGWMHNRVRMIVGSFLVKDLHIDWKFGMDWFWDTLVDADYANNTASWQWIAGCGADAAPFFRIFNPTTQSEKFDPDGDYIRTYVPELSALPAKYIHEPSSAPPLILSSANVELGSSYPHPIVDHGHERKVALARYQSIKTEAD